VLEDVSCDVEAALKDPEGRGRPTLVSCSGSYHAQGSANVGRMQDVDRFKARGLRQKECLSSVVKQKRRPGSSFGFAVSTGPRLKLQEK
jgi:hypothetical protein